MASDVLHPALLPAAWRLLLAFAAAALAIELLLTTQYYATVFFLALMAITLMFGVANVLQHSRGAADSTATERAIAQLQAGRKRAIQAQDHLQALLDTVSAALLIVKEDGRAAAANRAARQLLRDDGRRLRDYAVIGADAAQAIARLTPGARAMIRLANGRQMLAAAVTFTGDGESRRLVSLQAVMGELDAVQLQAWEDMSRILSHEIMNSLTPIASLSESLAGMMRHQDAGRDQIEAIDTIARRSQGLASFVARYRQMAELPEPQLQRIDLQNFADETGRLMAGHLGKAIYRSRIEISHVTADPELLSQAVINLLHNAVDAAATAAHPQIELTCTRQDGAVRISVSDNGSGVPADLADDIFQPFFTTKPGGSGIGLSLVRQVALKHGGQVQVTPRPEGGAVFQIILPER